MLINLTTTDFGSLGENVPRLKLSNMYLVDNPVSVSGTSYVSRPSITLFSTIASSNIRGIYFQQTKGVTAIYVVAGNTLYLLNNDATATALGNVPGSDFCTFASTIYYVAIASSGSLYTIDSSRTLTNIPIPDGTLCGDVTSLDNYLIVSTQNSGRMYFVRPGATVIQGLDYFNAERNPDDVVTVDTLGDEMLAVGQNTVEVFQDTGDQTAPFQRIPARVYQVGCADKHSVVRQNLESIPCLIWVTNTKEVVLFQTSPKKISNESIEELLHRSNNFVAWGFRTNRHDFYVLTTDNETIVYDINTDKWFRWSSYNKTTWDAYSGIQINDQVYVVNKVGGNIYRLTNTVVDNTLDYIVCEVGGFIPVSDNTPVHCNSITVFTNTGFSPSYLNGPLFELRWSDDQGQGYTPYYQGTMGLKGNYVTDVRYRSLGRIDRPGRYIEFRFSEIASIRIDGATMNDSASGN